MIVIGAIMVAGAPLSASDIDSCSSNLVVSFEDFGGRPLTSARTVTKRVSINLPVGVYDIVMTSADPTHGRGEHLDQMHESWFFTLDNGYVSPTTPDFDDDVFGVAIVVAGVQLESASSIQAVWAGQLPASDSVHPASVSFSCTRQTIATTSTTTTVAPTTTTSEAPPTTLGGVTDDSTTTVPTTEPSPTTTARTTAPATSTPPTTTSESGTTTTVVGEIGGSTEENPELAATGLSLNLAIGGFTLILAGFGLVTLGSAVDRRQLALVRS